MVKTFAYPYPYTGYAELCTSVSRVSVYYFWYTDYRGVDEREETKIACVCYTEVRPLLRFDLRLIWPLGDTYQ